MNPLLNNMNNQSQSGGLGGILQALKTRNPDDVARTLCNVNPAFRKFYEANRGKSVNQICSENGIDPQVLRQFIR